MKNAPNKVFIIGIILLIFFGIMILKTFLSEKPSEEEIAKFNQEFLQYEGSKNGKQVEVLLQKIVSSNELEGNEKRQIDLKADTIKDTKGNMLLLGEENGKKTLLRNSDIINPNKMYNISFEYKLGLIKTIIVK